MMIISRGSRPQIPGWFFIYLFLQFLFIHLFIYLIFFLFIISLKFFWISYWKHFAIMIIIIIITVIDIFSTLKYLLMQTDNSIDLTCSLITTIMIMTTVGVRQNTQIWGR